MRLRHFLPPTYRELRRSHVAFVESANLAVMWSFKAACTTVIKWVFLHDGLLPEALAYGKWIHRYRLRQYQKADRYLQRLRRFNDRDFQVIKIVRDPLDRAVSSYIHAYLMNYEDESIAKILGRPINAKQRFSFREFVTFLEQIDLQRCNPHHRVQVAPIERHVLFRTKPSTIIKIEHGLDASLNALERSLGLPVTDFADKVFHSHHHTIRSQQQELAADLVHFPKRAFPPTAAFYDAALSARVARLYAEDLRQYCYSADSQRSASAPERAGQIVGQAFRQAQN